MAFDALLPLRSNAAMNTVQEIPRFTLIFLRTMIASQYGGWSSSFAKGCYPQKPMLFALAVQDGSMQTYKSQEKTKPFDHDTSRQPFLILHNSSMSFRGAHFRVTEIRGRYRKRIFYSFLLSLARSHGPPQTESLA